MIESNLEFEVHDALIKFAKKENTIKAIHKGTDPEFPNEGNKVTYYLLTGKDSHYNREFEDRVTELDLQLHQTLLKNKEGIGIMTWPIDLEQADNYGFIEECIYKK